MWDKGVTKHTAGTCKKLSSFLEGSRWGIKAGDRGRVKGKGDESGRKALKRVHLVDHGKRSASHFWK